MEEKRDSEKIEESIKEISPTPVVKGIMENVKGIVPKFAGDDLSKRKEKIFKFLKEKKDWAYYIFVILRY